MQLGTTRIVHLSVSRFAAALAAVTLCIAAGAQGQSQRYTLGDEGKWVAQEPPAPGTDAAVIARARERLAAGDPDEARDILDAWIASNERSTNPFLAEAYLIRGDAYLALDREYTALYDYEAVIKKYRQSEHFATAVERELGIAIRYANGLKIRNMGIRFGDATDMAVELLIRVQERMPRSQLAERASIELADFYYRQREMRLANDAYDLYLQNFPQGPNRVKAAQRRIQTDIARFKGPRYSSARLINAREQLKDFMTRYPGEADRSGMNQAMLNRLDESMGAQLLDTAEYYERIGDWPSARLVYRRLLRDHPRTIAGERAEEILRANGWLTTPAPTEATQKHSTGGAPSGQAAENPASEPTGGAPEQSPVEPKPAEAPGAKP